MAHLDRLTPSYSGGLRSRRSCKDTRNLRVAKGVLKKYKNRVRYTQLRQLREMIPNLQQQQEIDEVVSECIL